MKSDIEEDATGHASHDHPDEDEQHGTTMDVHQDARVSGTKRKRGRMDKTQGVTGAAPRNPFTIRDVVIIPNPPLRSFEEAKIKGRGVDTLDNVSCLLQKRHCEHAKNEFIQVGFLPGPKKKNLQEKGREKES